MHDDVAAVAGAGLMAREGVGDEGRLLATLQRLLSIEATTVTDALAQAADHVAAGLHVEKVDAFLHDPARRALVAVGVSDTPLGQRERAIGLDVLPLDAGGRTAEVFRTGRAYMTGRADRDPAELTGFTEDLGIHSMLIAPFDIGGVRRGVLGVDAVRSDVFGADDLRFLEGVARWVGVVVHRTELAAQVAGAEAARAARAAAEAERARLLERERAARAQAEAAVRLRNDFLTVAAHDLRTPLTNMLGRLQLIGARLHRADGGALDPDWLRGQLDSAAASTQRLLGTVNELGDMARLQAGEALELDRAPVDLGALVRAAVEDVAVVGGSQGLATVPIEIDAPGAPVIVESDEGRLRRVLQNVLGNAVKYSPTGTPVRVEVRRRDGLAVVAVRDRGVGIPAAELPRIFERYYRASTARGMAGSGIGLSGAQAIVAQHGGTITIESVVGAGTTVTVTLPASTTAAVP
jgi:two-component system OmpR family sensor kinase